MKTTMTVQQAITLYTSIEALLAQFDRENAPKVIDPPKSELTLEWEANKGKDRCGAHKNDEYVLNPKRCFRPAGHDGEHIY